MDLDRLISLIATKSGSLPVRYHERDLHDFAACFAHPDVCGYLTQCLPTEGYVASGVRVHSLESIRGEVCKGAGPGGYIFPHGYVVVASDVGGNGICFHSPSGRVVWADHESFTDDQICYENRSTGNWCYLPFTPENVDQAVVPLNDNIEAFLTDLLHDRLEEQLDQLD